MHRLLLPPHLRTPFATPVPGVPRSGASSGPRPADGGIGSGCSCGGGCPSCGGHGAGRARDAEGAAEGATQGAGIGSLLGGPVGGVVGGAVGGLIGAARKVVTVDAVSLRGASRSPTSDINFANRVFSSCNVHFTLSSNNTATTADSDTWLGGDTDLDNSAGCGTATTEELTAYGGSSLRFAPSGRIRAFYVDSVASGDRGYSNPAYCATGTASGLKDMAAVTNSGRDRTLAHELGHILMNSGDHPSDTNNLMHPTNTATGNELTITQMLSVYWGA
ncbi:MAG: hypothetical protein ABIP59_17200 [Roseateles sp.]